MADVKNLKTLQGGPMPGTVVLCGKATYVEGVATQVVSDGGVTLGAYDGATLVVTLDESFSQLVSVQAQANAGNDGTVGTQVVVTVKSEDVDNTTTPIVTLCLSELKATPELVAEDDLDSLSLSLVLRNEP